jgi:hypothetical protein
MKFMSTFSVRPGCWEEAATRFLSGKAQPPEGLKLLGRWHNADLSGGFSLYETDDPAASYAFSAQWSDVLEMHSHLVVEDAEAGPALAQRYGK